MAGLTRLELATFRVTGERSNQTELQPLNVCMLAHQTYWEKISIRLRFLKTTA